MQLNNLTPDAEAEAAPADVLQLARTELLERLTWLSRLSSGAPAHRAPRARSP
jgi:hypothetical protein